MPDVVLMTFVFSLIAGFGDVLGGWLTIWWRGRLSARAVLYCTSIAAGFILGVVFLDRIPELFHEGHGHGGGISEAALWMTAGFLIIYALENVFAAHAYQQSSGHETDHHHGPMASHGYLEEVMHDHGHASRGSDRNPDDCVITPQAGWMAQIGLLLHSCMDGIAIGAGFAASPKTGMLMFLAVACHKIPEGFSMASLVLAAGRGASSATRSAMAMGAVTVISSMASLYFGRSHAEVPAILLALATGSFLYVAACDLLPATHRGQDNRAVALVITGAVLYALSSQALHALGLHP